MSPTNAELARQGWEAAMRGDLDVVASMLDPKVKWHGGDPDSEYACRNRSQALRWMERARASGPLPELVDVREAGDKVVLVLRSLALDGRGVVAATDPTGVDDGEELAVSANVSTFIDGKVVEMVHYERAEDALRAVGLEV